MMLKEGNMSKFVKVSGGKKGLFDFFSKLKPKPKPFDPMKFKKIKDDPKKLDDLTKYPASLDFLKNNPSGGLGKQFMDMLSDEKALSNIIDMGIGVGFNWNEYNLNPDQIASLIETADKGALQFSNAPETKKVSNTNSRFIKVSQEEQPEQENQKPQLPNFTIDEVVNNLVKVAQEAEANNLGEKEIAMSMAKVLRSYNDKLSPFKSQLREQGINLNDIAPRR